MAQVVDLWHNKDRTRTKLYGKGRRWQAIYVDPDGKRKRPMFTTRDEAEAALADNVAAVNTGTYVSKAQKELTFGELWPRFEKIKSTKAAKTQEMYAGTWNGYIEKDWGAPACATYGPRPSANGSRVSRPRDEKRARSPNPTSTRSCSP